MDEGPHRDDRGDDCEVCGLGFPTLDALLHHLMHEHDRAALLEAVTDRR